MTDYFLDLKNFPGFIQELLKQAKVIAPAELYGRLYLQEVAPEKIKEIELVGFRTVESFKSFLFKVREKAGQYFVPDFSAAGEKLVFLGARGCDLEALEVLDRVFGEGEFQDPFYIANRQKITIIGADCTDCGDTCFCTSVKGQPYPTKLCDLNFSLVKDGYVVEIATAKGKDLIKDALPLMTAATPSQIKEKETLRQQMTEKLLRQNQDFQLKLDLAEIHKRNLENKVWKILAKDCVECSACNFICPTCGCFLLLDQLSDGQNARYRVWDACLKNGYAKVAGGANPRGKLFQRLANRYQCKFDYSFDRLGRYACVGCGRCLDGCAGNIDMRKIFRELERQAPLTAKLE